ncbi:cyclase family protein [Candidatus Woesebacteria bacterium]|nr:cyclase family protein [Candidatus Woesebacteria bacterium]
MNYSKIIDISLPIDIHTIIYPGNPAVEIEELKSEASGSTISKIIFGTHTATHVDAQKHVIDGGKSLDDIPLDAFVGKCRVVDCTHDTEAVSLETVEKTAIQKDERILLKTQNSLRGFTTFYEDFVYVSPEAALYLSDRVQLVGIDYFSIKQKGSKDNRPHTAFLGKNIPIIEGIDLSQVEAGEYILIALPLKLTDRDGAPVRAVLLK